jgi:glycerol-3-phosphate dehydrogenase
VRYLEKAVFRLDYNQLRLVFDALKERRRMLDNAPHLTRPLPIMTVRSQAMIDRKKTEKNRPARYEVGPTRYMAQDTSRVMLVVVGFVGFHLNRHPRRVGEVAGGERRFQ